MKQQQRHNDLKLPTTKRHRMALKRHKMTTKIHIMTPKKCKQLQRQIRQFRKPGIKRNIKF